MLSEWLKKGFAKPGKTQRGLAAILDIDPAAVHRMTRGLREIKPSEIGPTARYLEEPVPPGLLEQTRPETRPVAIPTATARIVDLPSRSEMPADVPVYGVAAGSPDESFQLEDGIIDYVRRGPGIAKARDVYALFVTGESMHPRFSAGELVYVSPSRPPRPGDDVIICVKPHAPNEPERCYIKRLARRHPDRVDVEQFNPVRMISYPAAEVIRIHRVLTMAEVLGV